MHKRQILINAIMSSVQIVVVSGTLFVLYRFLLNVIGVEQLGIWSLVLATTSATQIANFGLSGSVVKYVARYVARKENENVAKVVQTAVITIALVLGVFLLMCYPSAKWLLSLIISSKSLPYAFDILPYALFSFWIMMLISVFQAGIDGFQRIDSRSLLLMGGAIFHLVLCFMLAPTLGLLGVAYARVIQNIAVLGASWLLLRRYLPELPLLPYKWDKGIFKEIIGYGMNFQLMTVTSLFFDPTTKALLSKFGGLSTVGYYEMASRMIGQFRSLIVQANQVLVPFIAGIHENIPGKMRSVYLTSYQLLFYLSLPLFSLIIISTPIISELWIGHYESTFVFSSTLLAIGWFLNMLNVPAYMANLGTGELRWNVIGQITIAVMNSIMGFALGTIFGGKAVIIAWVCSLAFGSSLVYVSYHLKNNISLIELLPKASRPIISTCFISMGAFVALHYVFSGYLNPFAVNTVTPLVFVMIVFVPFWLHPMRKRLAGWLTKELFKKF